MHKNNYILLLLCWLRLILLTNSTSHAAPATLPWSAETFASLLTEARTNNRSLRVTEARVTASQFGVTTVRRWEDPKFSFSGVVPGPRCGGLTAEGDLIYGIEQKLPLWDRPRLSRDILVANTQTQVAEAAARDGQLRRDIARTLLRLALTHRSLSYGTNDLAWLDTMIALQEEKFRAGMGQHTDLLQLQNEKGKRANALRAEESRLLANQATLNRLLGRDLNTPWPAIEMPPLAASVTYSPALANFAATNEPRAKVLLQEKAQAEAVARLTTTMQRPDVSLGLQGRQASGDAGLREAMFTVSLNLPWWNAPQYRAERLRDEAKVRTAAAQIADYELSVREEVLRLTLASESAQREAVLYRDEILQRTQQGLATMQLMWEGNRGTLREILEARRALLEAQRTQDRATGEQHEALIDLAALCDLPDYFQLPSLLARLTAGHAK